MVMLMAGLDTCSQAAHSTTPSAVRSGWQPWLAHGTCHYTCSRSRWHRR